jgi:hypothetical protein
MPRFIKSSKKGGSISSSRVNSLVPKLCGKTYAYPSPWVSQITPQFIKNNYGIEYKTTGGKRKKKSKKKQNGGDGCEPQALQDWGNKDVSDAHPTLNGIPLSRATKALDWFMGDSCFNCGPSRPDPTKAEFKTEPPQALEKGSFEQPRYTSPGFPGQQILPKSDLPLYEPLKGTSETNGKGASHNSLQAYLENKAVMGPSFNEIPAALAGGKKYNKKTKKNMKGSGSDWLSTVRSRGSYTAPNMSVKQFKDFNNTSEYIPNIELADGAASDWKPSPWLGYQSLAEWAGPANNPPLAYNAYNGVVTNSYTVQGGKKNKKKI